MTIIARFKSYEGIVLCADTQETIEHSKRRVPKLRYEPSSMFGSQTTSDLAAAFCGAGFGPWIDKLVEESWKAAQLESTLDGACLQIERAIKKQYLEFGQIYQVGQCPEVELIFGVKMGHQSRLFTAVGPIVNEKQEYDSSGTGQYMADFLAQRMYKSHLTLYQCVILAAYILFQAKEHVEGCGGESHIAVLREDGSSGLVEWKRVEAITELLEAVDSQIGELLIETANLSLSDDKLKEKHTLTYDILQIMRDKERDELANWDATSLLLYNDKDRDFLGLPKSSDSETSESEP